MQLSIHLVGKLTDLERSFWTGRYFTREEGRLVRETRKMRLPMPPPIGGSAVKVA